MEQIKDLIDDLSKAVRSSGDATDGQAGGNPLFGAENRTAEPGGHSPDSVPQQNAALPNDEQNTTAQEPETDRVATTPTNIHEGPGIDAETADEIDVVEQLEEVDDEDIADNDPDDEPLIASENPLVDDHGTDANLSGADAQETGEAFVGDAYAGPGIDAEISDEIDEIDLVEQLEEVDEEDIDDDDPETLETVDDVEGLEDAGNDHRINVSEESKTQDMSDSVGFPVDGLGNDLSAEDVEKLRKARLLAAEFDGYLGAMDRYFNHYVLIPEGDYTVGSLIPLKGEKPQQVVRMASFYIGRFPVTNSLFEIFIEKTGYRTTAEKVGYGTVYCGRFQKIEDKQNGRITSKWNASVECRNISGACWYQPHGPGSTLHNKRSHPVVQISLEDAMAFAAWTGKRLPTEDEWEAAARTTSGAVYPWGSGWNANACNIESSGHGDTTPVDRYIDFENEFSIADTVGNVLERTGRDHLAAGADDINMAAYGVAKGGSWVSGDDVRLSSRFKLTSESHSNILGFRCVAL